MKKRLVLLFTLLTIALVSFNFLSTEENTEDIKDSIHQKEFNSYFRSYTITTPDSIGFAEEYTPIYAADIWERYDKEIHKNVYWQSNTLFYFKRANKYFPIIESILKKNNIPNDFKYLAIIESGLENVVSPAGATGFWQFMKGTAKDRGMEVNSEVDERYNLEISTQAACDYLQDAYDKFGSWTMAAASYNVGMNGLQRRVTEQNSNNYYDLYLPMETSRYVFRLLAIKEIFENKSKYGFVLRDQDLYKKIKTETISLSEKDIDLFAYSDSLGINYKILKQFNPWIRDKKITNKSKKTYTIIIPKKHEINIFKTEEN
ncbi:MAG: lytic transglycosylase domain-containing protein [Flavobacteriales bacterium]|jgi:membrane-bound lytic murein transglycosylase D|nr:lytic transglycosylase domain-containing protein [Flavobacteriales bacterium]MBT5354504.1 lytic transglycosylase domain-containing protein [Flavobacteriales bacterium]MBT5698604.1 lytic transglycosylase domain-containing protein [Flavobacteriales bacterium]MBT6699223.1 lytic transglycosylase domain-containing protein [Flavobacteriales bacterium]MBT6814914.1 lytic transglycosylase domain-containing protein [Flavobacteriales bacterium]